MRTLKQIKRAAREIATSAAGQKNLQSFWISDRNPNPHLNGYSVRYTLPGEKSGHWIANLGVDLTREEFELYQDSDTDDWK